MSRSLTKDEKIEKLKREFCAHCRKCNPVRKAECYEWFYRVAELSDEIDGIPEPKL
jgi:hypothetical protein